MIVMMIRDKDIVYKTLGEGFYSLGMIILVISLFSLL